jgi:hypothetical protein
MAGSQVGDEDASHFSREYKRHFGDPPIRDIQTCAHSRFLARRHEPKFRGDKSSELAKNRGFAVTAIGGQSTNLDRSLRPAKAHNTNTGKTRRVRRLERAFWAGPLATRNWSNCQYLLTDPFSSYAGQLLEGPMLSVGGSSEPKGTVRFEHARK